MSEGGKSAPCRWIDSQDNPNSVSRFGGQAEPQAPALPMLCHVGVWSLDAAASGQVAEQLPARCLPRDYLIHPRSGCWLILARAQNSQIRSAAS